MNVIKELKKLKNMNTIFICPHCNFESYHRVIKIEKINENEYEIDWRCTLENCYEITSINYKLV